MANENSTETMYLSDFCLVLEMEKKSRGYHGAIVAYANVISDGKNG